MFRVEVVSKFLCTMNFVNFQKDHISRFRGFIRAKSIAAVIDAIDAASIVATRIVIIEFSAISGVVEDSILVY